MVTLDDIATAVKARCDASADFRAALPGGLHQDRGPDQPSGAYAVFTLALEGEPEWFSDGSYLQGYVLRLTAYTTLGKTDEPTPQQVQLAMVAALNGSPATWDALRDGSVNICLPRGYDGKHDPQLREGKDVFAAADQWHLLIEGTR